MSEKCLRFDRESNRRETVADLWQHPRIVLAKKTLQFLLDLSLARHVAARIRRQPSESSCVHARTHARMQACTCSPRVRKERARVLYTPHAYKYVYIRAVRGEYNRRSTLAITLDSLSAPLLPPPSDPSPVSSLLALAHLRTFAYKYTSMRSRWVVHRSGNPRASSPVHLWAPVFATLPHPPIPSVPLS